MLHLARRVPWLITRRLRRRFDAPLLLYTSGCNDYEYRSGPLNSLLVLTNFARKEIRRLDELVKESNGKQISRSGVLKVVDNIGSSLQAMRCISERDENERIKSALDSQPTKFQPFSIDQDILYFILLVDGTIGRNIFINTAGQVDNVPRNLSNGIPVVKEIMLRPRELPLGSVVSVFISNGFVFAVEDQRLVTRPLYEGDNLDADNTIFDPNTWFTVVREAGIINFFLESAAPNMQNICIQGGSESNPLELVNTADGSEICRPDLQQLLTKRLDRCPEILEFSYS